MAAQITPPAHSQHGNWKMLAGNLFQETKLQPKGSSDGQAKMQLCCLEAGGN